MSTKNGKLSPRRISTKNTGQSFVLPQAFNVVGTTMPTDTAGREILIEIGSGSKFRAIHLSIAALGSGDHKPLASELSESGYYKLARKPMLTMVADSILEKAATINTLVITLNGFFKLLIGEEKFNGYAWSGAVYWFGPPPPMNVIVSARTDTTHRSGTFPEWKTRHKGVIPGNPYLIVSYSHSLAAALCRAFDAPKLILLLVGPSTTGKSTTQKGAQSMIGHPSEVRTMSGTKAGIQSHLAAKPDQPVYFQDARQIDNANDLLDIIFDVADGAGKMKFGNPPKTIAAAMILSNERNFMDMAKVQKGSIDEGIYARLLEINFDGPHGAFHNLHGEPSAADFAKKLEAVFSECYGTVWPAWLKSVSSHWTEVTDLHAQWIPKIKTKIAIHADGIQISAINSRLLDALVFYAWVGCIASHLGILPVKKAEIADAFGFVFAQQLLRQLKGTTPLGDRLIKHVCGFLDENHARFPSLDYFDVDTHRSGVLGYRYSTKSGDDVFLFLPNVFQRFFVADYGNVAFSILKRSEFLLASEGRGNQFQARIPRTDERKSFIAIKASIRFDKK
jgi:hypothetical protein